MALARIGWLNRGINLQQSRSFIASAHEVLQQTDAAKLSELSNGVKVASYNNGRPTSVIGVWVDSGSRDESRATNGTGKFFQHLLAKGTSKRSAKQLESDLGKLGARLSSHLDRDHTAYYVTCLTKDAEKVVEILADVLKNSKLNAADVEAERDTILQLLEKSEEDYEQTVRDMLHTAAFQGTGYENNPLGNSDAVKSITREQIEEFALQQFRPYKVVFTGVGGVEHSQVSDWASKYFGDAGGAGGKTTPHTAVRFTGSEFRYRNDLYPYQYGALAVEGVHRGHPDEWALKVANEAVGEWDRLHAASLNSPNELAQELALHEEVIRFRNFNVNYTNAGLWGVEWIMRGNDLYDTQKVTSAIQKRWRQVCTNVTEEEVERAKAQLRVRLFQQLEHNAGLAQHIATEALSTGEVSQLSELWARIETLNAADIRESASRHIYDREIATAGAGRTEAFPVYQMLRTKMSWWRL